MLILKLDGTLLCFLSAERGETLSHAGGGGGWAKCGTCRVSEVNKHLETGSFPPTTIKMWPSWPRQALSESYEICARKETESVFIEESR